MRKLGPARIVRRLDYYSRSAAAELIPQARFARRLEAVRLELAHISADGELLALVNYYNKLAAGTPHPADPERRPTVRDNSRYYYDCMETRRHFAPSFASRVLLGDITHILDQPTILKSRPIDGDNQNSVLLKLNRLRRFQF